MIEPFNANEIFFTKKISKLLNLSQETISNGKGNFSFIKLSSDKRIPTEDLNLLRQQFQKRFGKRINYELKKVGALYYANLVKKIN